MGKQRHGEIKKLAKAKEIEVLNSSTLVFQSELLMQPTKVFLAKEKPVHSYKGLVHLGNNEKFNVARMQYAVAWERRRRKKRYSSRWKHENIRFMLQNHGLHPNTTLLPFWLNQHFCWFLYQLCIHGNISVVVTITVRSFTWDLLFLKNCYITVYQSVTYVTVCHNIHN